MRKFVMVETATGRAAIDPDEVIAIEDFAGSITLYFKGGHSIPLDDTTLEVALMMIEKES